MNEIRDDIGYGGRDMEAPEKKYKLDKFPKKKIEFTGASVRGMVSWVAADKADELIRKGKAVEVR